MFPAFPAAPPPRTWHGLAALTRWLNAAMSECLSMPSLIDLRRSSCILPAAEKTRSTPENQRVAHDLPRCHISASCRTGRQPRLDTPTHTHTHARARARAGVPGTSRHTRSSALTRLPQQAHLVQLPHLEDLEDLGCDRCKSHTHTLYHDGKYNEEVAYSLGLLWLHGRSWRLPRPL